MTERDAFRVQALSDYRIFRILLDHDRQAVPACHPLHYLQMSTEKLAKATMIALGEPMEKLTHVAFSNIPHILARNEIARRLGWQNGKSYRQFLRKTAPIFREIDELNPSVGTQGSAVASRLQSNVEYPWQSRDSAGNPVWNVPANHRWSLMQHLLSGQGAQVLQFVEALLERFDAVFH